MFATKRSEDTKYLSVCPTYKDQGSVSLSLEMPPQSLFPTYNSGAVLRGSCQLSEHLPL